MTSHIHEFVPHTGSVRRNLAIGVRGASQRRLLLLFTRRLLVLVLVLISVLFGVVRVGRVKVHRVVVGVVSSALNE